MALFADLVRFSPAAGGTTDWTYSAAVQGYQSPTAGGMISGQTYKYRAESADLLQWEIGEGSWNGTVLARTTVFYNSLGTTAKISFTVAPQVAVVAMTADIQNQKRTRSVVASVGSSTYTTAPGCKAINVRLVGGGGGGGGSSTGTSGGVGGNGGNTTFGTSLLVANGGAGVGNASQGGSGGSASGGDVNLGGGTGQGSSPAGNVGVGGAGGNSIFGGGGGGGASGNGGIAGSPNTGGGGGGGGGTSGAGWTGAGGGAGGYCEKLIVGPAATYAYSCGAGGAGGTAGTGGFAAGGGGVGIIIVDEYY